MSLFRRSRTAAAIIFVTAVSTISLEALTPVGAATGLGAPTLDAGSDSGRSTSDGNTNATNLSFTMVGTLGSGEKWQLVRDPGASEVAVTSTTSPVVDAAVPEGVHSYVVRVLASDNSVLETSGPTAVTVDRTAPTAVAGTPDLESTSDSSGATGTSSDDITKVANPSLVIGVTGSLVGDDRLELLRNAAIVAAGSASPLVDTGAPEGVQLYAARVTDLAGNGTTSGTLSVTIDRTANAPVLALVSDTGRSASDRIITTKNQATGTFSALTMTVTGEPGATIRNLRRGINAAPAATDRALSPLSPALTAVLPLTTGGGSFAGVGTVIDALNGTNAPTQGAYTYTIVQEDRAGNLSAAGSINLTIDTTSPSTPGIALDPSTDTGPSSSDAVTRWDASGALAGANTALKLNLTGDTDSVVDLWRDGTAVSPPTAAPFIVGGNGSTTFTDTASFAFSGVHGYVVRYTDVAGNESYNSLGPYVDLDNPDPGAKPDLVASSDIGTSDADDITNDNTPTFRITGVEDTATVYLYRCPGAVACSASTLTPAVTVGNRVLVGTRTGPGEITAPVTADNSAANTSWRFAVGSRDLAGRFSGNQAQTVVEPATLSVHINVVIDTTPELAPAAPVLIASSQTGPGASAERTSAVSPTFNVVKGTGRVQLLRDGTVVGTSVGAGDITDPGPLANGTYRYTTRSLDTAGNASPESAATTVTIANGTGYWLLAQDGGVFSFGSAPFLGSTGDMNLNSPVMSMATTPNKDGYWLLAKDGGVFSFGEAGFFGSTGDQTLNSPIVGMVPTPSGKGYWLFAEDGGVFAFGDAPFHGSPASESPTSPMAAMLATSDGTGYWLVTKDGKVYAYGTATALSGVDGTPLNFPIVGMAATPSGDGLWLVASDGGIFALGDAVFLGSAGDIQLNQRIIGMLAMPDGRGYALIARDGGVFTYGEAPFLGSTGGMTLNAPIVGIAGA